MASLFRVYFKGSNENPTERNAVISMLYNPETDDDLRPILVEVKDGRYDMFASNPPTPRAVWLSQMLKSQGGVNESVKPGKYHYNVTIVDGVYFASLQPAEV